jgi:hypothetical protein
VPASSPRPAAQPDSSYETERVREFQPRETATLEAAPAPAPERSAGFAPAAPVKIEWPSDLQQVESDPGKVQEAAHADDPRESLAPRPRRVRQPRPQTSEEPLVQIETGAESPSGEKTPA